MVSATCGTHSTTASLISSQLMERPDFADSPEYPFARDLSKGETRPKRNETYVTDSGPFGAVGNYTDTKTYAQYQWLEKDLAAVDRTKTPWVFAMTHRPMYSSQVSSYQKNIRAAFQGLLLEYEVDVYLSGHIHWYERLFPLTETGQIDTASIINNNTYYTNPGKSMTHIINGAAGNIESHSTLAAGASPLNITAVLDQEHYGFLKLKVFNCSALSLSYIEGNDGSTRDVLTLLKKDGSCAGTGSGSGSNSSSSTSKTHAATRTSHSSHPSGTGSKAVSTSIPAGVSTHTPGKATTTGHVHPITSGSAPAVSSIIPGDLVVVPSSGSIASQPSGSISPSILPASGAGRVLGGSLAGVIALIAAVFLL